MRMPKNELFRVSLGNLIEREVAFFFCDRGVKNNLQQKIAELFLQVRGIACFLSFLDRIKRLVGFFEQVLR